MRHRSSDRNRKKALKFAREARDGLETMLVRTLHEYDRQRYLLGRADRLVDRLKSEVHQVSKRKR